MTTLLCLNPLDVVGELQHAPEASISMISSNCHDSRRHWMTLDEVAHAWNCGHEAMADDEFLEHRGFLARWHSPVLELAEAIPELNAGQLDELDDFHLRPDVL